MRRFCVIIAASLFFLSCTDIYQPKVEMNTSTIKSDGSQVGIGDFVTARDLVENLNLDPPKQLLVSQGIYNNKVELTWTPVKNANSYDVKWVRILRSEFDNKATEKDKRDSIDFEQEVDNVNAGMKTDLFSNSWTHVILPTPSADATEYNYYYFYQVTAKNSMNTKYKSENATTPVLLPEKDSEGNELPLFTKRDSDGAPILTGTVNSSGRDITSRIARYIALLDNRLKSHFVRVDEASDTTTSTDDTTSSESGDSTTDSAGNSDSSGDSGAGDEDATPDTPVDSGSKKVTIATTTLGRNMGYLFGTPQGATATKGASSLVTGTASDAYNDIIVSWQPVMGADYYHVYKSNNQAGNNAALQKDADTLSDTCRQCYFRDDVSGYSGTHYFYMVAAVKDGNESCLSLPAEGFTKVEGAPEPPVQVRVTNGLGEVTSGLKVEWILQAPSDLGELTYTIYRSKSTDGFGSTEKLKDGLAGTKSRGARTSRASNREDEVTWCDEPFVDNTAAKNIIYCYYVQTVLTKANGETAESTFSDSAMKHEDESGNLVDNENRAMGFILSPPVNEVEVSTSEKDSNKVKIAWSKAPGSEYLPKDAPFKYTIYCGDDKDHIKTSAATAIPGDQDPTRDNYLTTECDSANYFQVVTSNNGMESERTEAVAPAPNAPTNVYATKTDKIDGHMDEKNNANANGVFPVKITWSAPSGGIAPSYYAIQRSTKKTSGFKTITATLIKADGAFEDATKAEAGSVSGVDNGVYYYIDPNPTAKPEEYYYYKVVTKNPLKQGSKSNPFSDSSVDTAEDRKARGYGALTHDQWFREFNKTTITSHKKMEHLNKKSSLDKLGSDTTKGEITGTVDYNAKMDGLGARITIEFKNYCDAVVKSTRDVAGDGGKDALGFDCRYFTCNGFTNTKASMDESGTMDGTVWVTGNGYKNIGNNENGGSMYPGTCVFDKLKVKGGDAGGGTYPVTTYDLKGEVVLPAADVRWNAAM